MCGTIKLLSAFMHPLLVLFPLCLSPLRQLDVQAGADTIRRNVPFVLMNEGKPLREPAVSALSIPCNAH